MRRVLGAFLVSLFVSVSIHSQTAPDAAELTKLLNDFLAGASKNDAATHERFWADDLIYTGSAGRRVGKADIMADVRKSPTPTAGPPTLYTAEDIRIQQYGNTAIVAFRLVGTVDRGKQKEVTNYFNTGTFLKRNGKWQVVAWNATRLVRPEATAKAEIAAVEANMNLAMLQSNTELLESVLDESFVWTRDTGEQFSRQKLIDDFKSGRLKYTKVQNMDTTISVTGETGVVRGKTARERNAAAGSTQMEAFTAFYTLTVVNKAGPWKAVALHTSR